MYTDVYVDVLFLINFSMDALSLFVTARLCSMKAGVFRLSLAALIGALYSVVVLFFGIAVVFEIVTFISISVIMVCVAFKPLGIREIFKTSGVLFISSALLGGTMSAFYSVLSNFFRNTSDVSEDDSLISPILVLVLALISLCTSLLLTKLHGSGKLPDCADVEIVFLKKKRRLRGIFDSGNMLTEPLSGRPVIPVRASCLRGIVSNSFIKTSLSRETEVDKITDINERSRFRLIPAKGIGGSTYMHGLIPDSVTLIYSYRGKERVIQRDAVIALMRENEADVECIIPSSII